jgi:hypothetical protein
MSSQEDYNQKRHEEIDFRSRLGEVIDGNPSLATTLVRDGEILHFPDLVPLRDELLAQARLDGLSDEQAEAAANAGIGALVNDIQNQR